MAVGTVVSEKERACIRKARQTRVSAAQARLNDIAENGIPYESPFRIIKDKMAWEDNIGGIIKQIILLPVMIVIFSFILVIAPFSYTIYLRDVRKEKLKLKDEINRWSAEPHSFKVPDIKQLATLWSVHGIEPYKYSFETQLFLLGQWLDILYGKKVSETLNLDDRIAEIQNQQSMSSLDALKKLNKQDVPIVPPIAMLIRRLSDELPPYEICTK
ncbi:MAG: hypothetical protein CSYNP_00792 [Syntrophus sp. SKADARSKE-3]|nr:hypothetical protein [Syntrophus sp. SKADARSKE-3]